MLKEEIFDVFKLDRCFKIIFEECNHRFTIYYIFYKNYLFNRTWVECL